MIAGKKIPMKSALRRPESKLQTLRKAAVKEAKKKRASQLGKQRQLLEIPVIKKWMVKIVYKIAYEDRICVMEKVIDAPSGIAAAKEAKEDFLRLVKESDKDGEEAFRPRLVSLIVDELADWIAKEQLEIEQHANYLSTNQHKKWMTTRIVAGEHARTFSPGTTTWRIANLA